MAEVKEEHSNWFVQVEDQFKDKLLHIVAGIGAWGALFPAFYGYSREIFINRASIAFLVYLSIFILAPLLLVLFWLWASGRLKKGELERLQASVVRSGSKTIFFKSRIRLISNFRRIFILLAIGITVLFGLFFIIWYIGLLPINGRQKPVDEDQSLTNGSSKNNLVQFDLADELWKDLNSLERKVKNIADRYLVKSKISVDRYEADCLENIRQAWDTLQARAAMSKPDSNFTQDYHLLYRLNHYPKQTFDSLLNTKENRRIQIRLYLQFFNALILHSPPTPKPGSKITNSAIMYTSVKDGGLGLNDNDSAAFNDSLFFRVDNIVGKWRAHSVDRELPFIHVITETLDSMFSGKDQRIYPEHIYLDPVYMSRLSHYKMDSTLFKNYLTARINYLNSTQLYHWVDTFRAYCQRKTQSELDKKRGVIAGTWKEGRYMGLSVFIILLCFLGFTWYSLWREKRKILEKKKVIEGKQMVDDQEIKKLETDTKTVDHYIFPISTFFFVLLALAGSLLKDVKPEDIQFTSPNWMINSPNWNLITASSVAFDNNTNDDAQKGKGENGDNGLQTGGIQIQLESMKQEIRMVSDTVDSLQSTANKIHDFLTKP